MKKDDLDLDYSRVGGRPCDWEILPHIDSGKVYYALIAKIYQRPDVLIDYFETKKAAYNYSDLLDYYIQRQIDKADY